MKCKKGSRRAHFHLVGPSLLMKVVKEDDSFIRFAGHHEMNWQWEKRLREFHTDALFREDPFGAQEYSIPYSMDKRRRWIVPDIIEEEIESVQDPSRSLRVSASIHSLSTNRTLPILQKPPWGWRWGSGDVSQVEELPTREYHDVLRDGRVKHRARKHAMLMTLASDENPKKKKGPERRREPAVEPVSTKNLSFDKDQRFQKAHVRYNVIQMVHDKRKVHLHNNPTYMQWWAYDTTHRDAERDRRALLWRELRDLGKEEVEDDVFQNDVVVEDIETPKGSTLMDCVVQKNSLKRRRKHSVKTRFIDEPSRVKIAFPDKENEEEDDEDFEIVQPSELRLSANAHLPSGDVDGTCPICVEPFEDGVRPFSLDCGHPFCTDCWMRQAEVCLSLGCDEVGCMDPRCSEILSNDAAKRLFSQDSLAYYMTTVQEARIRKGKARRCPQCRWTVGYSGAKADVCSCGALLCGLCSSLFHGSLPCDKAAQYNAYLKRNGMDTVLSSLPSANIVTELVRCPSCTMPLQRSVGCDHMVCVCGAPFCFKCGRERDVRHDSEGCRKKELEMVVLLDVFIRTGASAFSRKLLAEALRRRVELAMRKREISAELRVLPLSKARMYMRKIEAISVLLESSILQHSDHRVVSSIELALYRFLNGTSGNGSPQKLMRRADEMVADCCKLANIN